jgi:hypothetical protein
LQVASPLALPDELGSYGSAFATAATACAAKATATMIFKPDLRDGMRIHDSSSRMLTRLCCRGQNGPYSNTPTEVKRDLIKDYSTNGKRTLDNVHRRDADG